MFNGSHDFFLLCTVNSGNPVTPITPETPITPVTPLNCFKNITTQKINSY